MSNFVFVLDTQKRPLNPIQPGGARKLLANGKAAVFRRYQFTLILKKEVTANPEPIILKIDPGSKTTGIALVLRTQVIWGAELTHRGQAIKARHRTRPKGWLAPSLQHRVETTLTRVKRLIKLAPISSIAQELVRFDLPKIENPEISGVEYQQGTLFGYEVREYLLNKWDRKCAYCGVENMPLQIEPIHPKAKGGSNRISHLCLACEKCNTKKGTQNIGQFLAKKPDILKRILSQAKRPLKDAATVNSTRWALFNRLKETGLPVSTGSGGLTKFNRTQLNLPKTHWIDGACVGQVVSLEILASKPLLIKASGHGTRQMCRADKFGFPSRYVPRFKFVKGFQTGDIVKAIVTTGKKIGTYISPVAVGASGSFNISASELVSGISYKYCSTIHRKDGYSYAA